MTGRVPNQILMDLGPLRDSRDFRLLFVGQMVNMLGNQLTVVAIPFQVYELDAVVLPGRSRELGAGRPSRRWGARRRLGGKRRGPPNPHDHDIARDRHDERGVGRQRLSRPSLLAADLRRRRARRRSRGRVLDRLQLRDPVDGHPSTPSARPSRPCRSSTRSAWWGDRLSPACCSRSSTSSGCSPSTPSAALRLR